MLLIGVREPIDVRETRMQEVEITIGRLLRIGWLFVWRATIGGAIAGGIVGFVIGLVMGAAGSPREHLTLITSLAGLAAGTIWSLVVLKMALEKRYQDFRIALIAR
jgi:multisubunit Na+/H+ antiporter MnhE subunit